MFESSHLPAEVLARQAVAFTSRATDSDPTTGLQQFGFFLIFFFPVLAFITLSMRVYGRVTTSQFGLDDALVCVAMAMSIAETVATYYFMKTNYIGIHFVDIPPHDPKPPLIWNFAVQVLYNPILAVVKTSVLLFLLRLGAQKRSVQLSIHALNAFNIALMIAIFIVVIFQCHPISYNWDTSIEGGKCIQQGTFYLVTAALTIFTDLLVLALPFWIFLGLKMALKLKIALLCIFLMGFIVTGVSIGRLVFIYQAFFTTGSADPTYTLGFCTSAIETNLAIITASAPALRGLFRSWFPRLFSSNSRYAGTSDRYADNLGLSNGYGVTSKSHATVGSSFALKDLKGAKTRTEVRGTSPTASEEEIMTYNGIMRTTNVSVHYGDEGRSTTQSKGESSKEDFSMRTSMGSM